MKRALKHAFVRLKAGWGEGTLSFAAMLGATSAIVSLLPGESASTPIRLLSLGLSILTGLIIAWTRGGPSLSIADDLNEDALRFKVVCPCTDEMAMAANLMTRAFYLEETIPWEKYRAWHRKNRNILCLLVDSNNIVNGYFDFLPLRSEAYDAILDGTRNEMSIGGEDILAPEDAKNCCKLYLGGLAVRKPKSYTGGVAARCLIWAAMNYLEKYYPSDHWTVISLASTKAGEGMLVKLGFQMLVPGENRKDGHNCYGLELDARGVAERKARAAGAAERCELLLV